MLGEWLIVGIEIGFFVLSFYVPIALVLTADWLILSPLKIGRALLYDTFVCDQSAVSVRLLFRYYRFGYGKTLCWRLLLWVRFFFISALLSFPLFLLRFFNNGTTFQVLFDWGYAFLLVIAFILLVIVMFNISPTSFLVIYAPKHTCFYRHKKVYGNLFATFSSLYNYAFKRFPLFFLSPVRFMAEYRIRQADTAHQKIEAFLQKQLSQKP